MYCIVFSHACKSFSVSPTPRLAVFDARARGISRHAPALHGDLLQGMAEQGYGKGYQYPHDDPRGVVPGNYFPMHMQPRTFYEPTDRGFEAEVRTRLERVRSIVRW
jgi:putative ATPase